MATTQRIRKVETRTELDAIVDDLITQEYKIVSEGKDSVQLKRTDWGTASMHILIFLIFGWCSFGVAKLAYALVANSKAERVLVRVG